MKFFFHMKKYNFTSFIIVRPRHIHDDFMINGPWPEIYLGEKITFFLICIIYGSVHRTYNWRIYHWYMRIKITLTQISPLNRASDLWIKKIEQFRFKKFRENDFTENYEDFFLRSGNKKHRAHNFCYNIDIKTHIKTFVKLDYTSKAWSRKKYYTYVGMC